MKLRDYQGWIASYLARFTEPAASFGQCQQAAQEMHAAFPELRIVAGHVDTAQGKRAHWWLVDRTGAIVDPTAAQFPSAVWYEEHRDGDPVRTGACLYCAADIWDVRAGRTFCGEGCERGFAAHLGAP